jgi:uncharacterized protein (DUF342 family)
MPIKGNIDLEIDEQGVEVRITITPDPNGADISAESLQAMLTEKKVRTGVSNDAIDKALRTLARKNADPLSFIAAAGVPPQPPAPESVLFEPAPVPERLASVARTVLAAAPQPRGFRVREEKVKLEKKVLKKAALPFLRPKEEIEVVFEKNIVREDVTIDPTVTDTGFVSRGVVVARVRPGKPGKQGKSVFGRPIPASRPDQDGFLFCEGLERTGSDVTAVVTGFLRKGATWCDVVPFRDHSLQVAASPDGLTCYLSVTPGDSAAPQPDSAEVFEQAQKLGFDPATLLPAVEIEAMIRRAIARKTPLVRASITPIVNGVSLVTVSADKLKAILYLRKGRGGGTPLTPAHAAEAIRTSKVRGFNPEKVKADLLAFFRGTATELADYILVNGVSPKPAADAKIDWRALFLPAEESNSIRAQATAHSERLSGLASLAAFPIASVEAVARVKPGAEVLKVVSAGGGTAGVDVYGASIPVGTTGMPDIRLFEGLALQGPSVVTTKAGILEKGSNGKAILLRVRPHKDAELHVAVSPDHMKATLSFSPAEGDGAGISVEEARSRLQQAQVVRGIDEARLGAVLERISRGEPIIDEPIAQGKPPQADPQKRVQYHVHLASGKAVALRKDGRADFRAQDRITRVSAGELVATVRPRDPAAEDGWDVSGAPVSLPQEAHETLQAGRGVREDLQPDGSVRFTAEAAGELVRDGAVLSVMQIHSIDGNVDMATGNVNFPGNVHVSGSVRSGFTIVAGGILEIGEAVEAALLSAGGTISIGQGIKGEGKAILRSRRDIESMFAEQAVLLAIGDVHLRGPCVRCQIKCNGKLVLDSEKGSLVGGEVRVSRGVVLQNIGSPGGVHTIVTFGQDFLVKDRIEREEREVAALAAKVADLDAVMVRLQKQVEAAGAVPAGVAAQSKEAVSLARVRAQKLTAMKLMEQRKLRLIALHDKYDEHVPSEIVVRGTLFPGVILECHGRRYESRTEKKMITLQFDPLQGKIVEKL